MKRLSMFVLSLLLLLGSASAFAEKAPAQGTKTLHLQIEGMTCGMCSAKLEKKLSALCTEVSVDHATGHGACVYETAKTSEAAIVKVVSDTGYKVVSTSK